MNFKLTCTIVISAYTEVEAETLQEAIKLAADRDMAITGLSQERKDECWMVNEIDGIPENIMED